MESRAAASNTRDQSQGGGGEEGNSQSEKHDRDEFPRVDEEEIPASPISEYASQIAFHPNQRRAAITTGEFGDGLQLYIVERVRDADSVADVAWQITEFEGIVAGMEWDANNRLRYNEWFTRYERKLPPSNKIFEPSVIDEMSFEGVNSL